MLNYQRVTVSAVDSTVGFLVIIIFLDYKRVPQTNGKSTNVMVKQKHILKGTTEGLGSHG